MNSFDLTPLLRSTIGYDRFSNLLDNAFEGKASAYPPYNIEKIDADRYRITLALAGFDEKDMQPRLSKKEARDKTKTEEIEEESSENFIYKGIANRAFERSFSLADHIKVIDAHMDQGLLHVNLEREIPEAKKPRRIAIAQKKIR